MTFRKVLEVFAVISAFSVSIALSFSTNLPTEKAYETKYSSDYKKQIVTQIKQNKDFLIDPRAGSPWDTEPGQSLNPGESLNPGQSLNPGESLNPSQGLNPNNYPYSDNAYEDSLQLKEIFLKIFSFIGIFFSIVFSLFSLTGLISSDNTSTTIIVSNVFLNLFFMISILFVLLKKDKKNSPIESFSAPIVKVFHTKTYNENNINSIPENNIIKGQISFDNLIYDNNHRNEKNNNTERQDKN